MYLQVAKLAASPVILGGGKVYYFDSGACSSRCGLKGLRRLGVGTVEGQEIGKGIIQAAALTGPAAPVVAAVGAVVDLVSEFFGGGCGNACVEAAQLEQVVESALNDIQSVAQSQPTAMSQSVFEEAYNAIMQNGLAALTKLAASDPSHANAAIANIQEYDNSQTFVQSLPATATTALNLTAAQTTVDSHPTQGWYAASVQAGGNLVMQILQQIAASSTGGVSGTVASLAASTGLPSWALLLGGAALLYAIL